MRGDPRYNAENSVHTRSSIWRMYRDAADQDYLMARFSARSNLIYQFWWNAQQSIEKYLKSILLLNNVSTIRFGHDLDEMYLVASDLAGGLAPSILSPPWFISSSDRYSTISRFRTVSDFIARVGANGDPNSRYRIFSTTAQSNDLIYFDELCFKLRRLAFPLDFILSNEKIPAREWLATNPEKQLHTQMGFEDQFTKKTTDIWQQHFEWCNFSYFYQSSFDAGEYPRMGGAINAEPFLRLRNGGLDDLQSIRWIALNSFPNRIRAEVNEAVESGLQKKT